MHSFIAFLILLVLSCSSTDAQEACTDSNRRRGICNEIGECLSAIRDLPDVRSTICRWVDVRPIICCASDDTEEITSRPMPSKPVTPSDTPLRRPNDISYPGCGRRPALENTGRSAIDDRRKDIHRPNITGKVKSKENAWPWMAAIYLHRSRLQSLFLCVATVISPRYILTAAYCFQPGTIKEPSPSDLTVFVGSNVLLKGMPYRVEKFLIHDQYTSSFLYHDIALVKVDKDISFSNAVMPVCLPSLSFGNLEDLTGKPATLIGWRDGTLGRNISNTLLEATIPIVSNRVCAQSYPNLPHGIVRGQLCAGLGEDGKDACLGDSGGPLVLEDDNTRRWTIVGIVSFGKSCGLPGVPGVYTRVARYMPWISRNTDLSSQ